MARLTLLLGAAALLASTAPASAGPVAGMIGAAAAAFGGAIGAGAVLKAGAQLVLGLALSLASQALRKQPSEGRAVHGTQGQVSVGGDAPPRVVAGLYATPGHLVHAATHGKYNKTPNAYFSRVVLLSWLPGAQLRRVLVDEQWVTLDGTPHPDYGQPVLEFRGVSGKDFLWIKFHDGFQTAADGGLLATLGGAEDRPWLADMIGRGCVMAQITARYAPGLFPGGLNFDVKFEMHEIPLYDPRADSTAGGSGSQRWADRATWTASQNPVVAVYNVLRGLRYGGQIVYGPGYAAHRLPLASWIAAMNACDVATPLAGGGTEPAYRFGVEIDLAGEPRDVVQQLLKGCCGDIAQAEGKFYVRAGPPAAPVFAFADADLVYTEPGELDAFPGLEETYNGVVTTYPDPASGWETIQAAPLRNADYLAADGGRQNDLALDLPTAPFPGQAQRVQAAILEDNRRFRVHVLTIGPEAWRVAPLATVVWSSDRNGYGAKLFEVRKRRVNPNGSITWVLREVDPTDHDWSTDLELPTAVGYLGRGPKPIQPPGSWSVEGGALTVGGQPRRAYIRLQWPVDDMDGIQRVCARVRVSGQTVIVHSSVFEDVYPDDPEATTNAAPISGATILGNVTYLVQGWFVGADGQPSGRTPWMEVTTPEVALGPADFSPGAVTMALLSEDVIDLIETNSSDGFEYVELATAARDAATAARDAALAAAVDAAGDASAAATSATHAESKADDAENWAAAASASRVAAQTARDAAQGHATAAGTHVTTAAGHASAAATSASTATTRRNEAQAARDTAQTSATASVTARDQAEAAVDDAAGFATAAQQAVTAATAQANLAQGRATTAQTAASAASASAAEASTFAGVSASLGAGNLIASDVFAAASIGRWSSSGTLYSVAASSELPAIAPVGERSLRLERGVAGGGLVWEGGWRDGSLRGRSIRITGWIRSSVAGGASYYLGIVGEDVTGARLVDGRKMVAGPGQNWAHFDITHTFAPDWAGSRWRPEMIPAGGDGESFGWWYRPRIEVIDENAREASAAIAVETTARVTERETMARFLVRTQLLSGSRRVITGFGFQSSIAENGTPESEFEILADKFKVVAPPSVSGQPAKTMFAVQNVAGAAQVVINGTLYADGAFLTRMIGANQVSREAWSVAAGNIAVSDTWTTVGSVTITRTAGTSARIDVAASWFSTVNPPPSYRGSIRIRRDGVTIVEYDPEDAVASGSTVKVWVDGANVSGSTTYTWQSRAYSGDVFRFRNRTINVQELKR